MKKIKTKDIYKKGNYSFIELEKYIENNNLNGVSAQELLSTFSLEDIIYLKDALCIPKEYIEKEVQIYDSASPRMNADTYIYNLAQKYNVDEATIIRRIQEIRLLRQEEEQRFKTKIKNQ